LAEWETVYLYLVAHGFPVSPSDVRAMLDELHSAYAVYYAWVQSNIEFVQRTGYLRTLYSGRIRWFGQYPKPTEVANYPIQGGIADFMNERLPLLDDKLPRGCQVIAQIHDAAIIECVKSEAQNVVDLIREVYDPPYCMPNRQPFVIPAEPKVGDRWSQFG
jgi:DNA polymerase I-like protein with 3'-5' exonuclease and polymerase domains